MKKVGQITFRAFKQLAKLGDGQLDQWALVRFGVGGQTDRVADAFGDR